MFPLSETRPTALMPVAGRPVVKHLIQELQSIGVDDIYLVTNHLEEQFEEEFGEYTNVNTVHQDELSGTAAAVETCDFMEEEFIVVNGDVLVSEGDLASLRQKHRNSDADVAMLATEEDRPEKFGVLSITNDKVVSIQEKPEDAENPLVNTGIYMFSPSIFDAIEELDEDETSITDAVNSMMEDGDARFELVRDYWIDIGSPRKLLQADKIKREYGIQETEVSDSAEVHETVEIDGRAVVEKGAELKPGTVLEGDVFIGENSVIGPNTVISDSSVAEDSRVESARVDSSVVFDLNIVDPFCHIENTVLGEEADVKPGSVIRESFIGARSFIEMNNSIRSVKFVPDARTDLGEISK